MNLTITLEADTIREAITKALAVGPNIMSGNPLFRALSKAITESEPRLEAWAREQVHTVLGDDSFRRELRGAIRQAMLAEAQSMGRKAARAAVNAKEAAQ